MTHPFIATSPARRLDVRSDDSVRFNMARNLVGFHRDKAWLGVVRGEPCIRCHAPAPVDPHHVFGSFGPKKTSDYASIPACRVCHNYFEDSIEGRLDGVAYLAVFMAHMMSKIKEVSDGISQRGTGDVSERQDKAEGL